MYREAAGSGCRIDHSFVCTRIKHFDAHFDYIARSEELAFFSFAGFTHKIFEGVVHNIKVRVEQLYILQARNANCQMRRR